MRDITPTTLRLGLAAALALGLGLSLGAGPALADAGQAVGTWSTKTGRQVKLSKCGANLCGTIVKAEAGAKDENNPDASKRSRPLVGVQILNAKPDGDGWKGTLYNTRDGKSYTGKVTIESANSIKLEGCVLGGLVCQGESWSRVN